MNIFDLFGQFQRIVTYPRSWRTLLTSLVAASIVTGLTFDLLYGTLYRRIGGTSHTRYGLPYWAALVILSIVVPLGYAVYRAVSWNLRLRPFGAGTLGIAIAQFKSGPRAPNRRRSPIV